MMLVAQGMTSPEVAKLLGDAARTVQCWVKRFEHEGLAGLVDKERPGRPSFLTEPQLEEINRVLRQTPRAHGLGENLWDGKILSAFIEKRYRVQLGIRQCQRLFRPLGFRLRKPRPAIAHADPVLQKRQKKTESVESGFASGLVGRGRSPFPAVWSRWRMWIPPEVVDPVLWHHPTRKSVGYFGAVRLRDGKLVYQREEGKFNKETYFRFLQHLRRCASHSGGHAVVIVDNASYHHARLHKTWRELHSADFQLYYLRPYSPELNPIERVWKLTRRKCLNNQYLFPTGAGP